MSPCRMRLALLSFFVISGLGAASQLGAAQEDKTPEDIAWEQVNSLDKQRLKDFLTQFPDGAHSREAKLGVTLQEKIAAIRTGKVKPYLIPFGVLGARWQSWQQRNPDKGVIGYFVRGAGKVTLPSGRTTAMK